MSDICRCCCCGRAVLRDDDSSHLLRRSHSLEPVLRLLACSALCALVLVQLEALFVTGCRDLGVHLYRRARRDCRACGARWLR